MNTLFLYLLIAFPGDSIQDPYSLKDRYNDSLHIYRTYLNLSKTHETDTAILNPKIRRAHNITCAAQSRLSAFNGATYEPTQGLYPKPSEKGYEGMFIPSGPQLRFTTYDLQTKFLTRSDGKTSIPYVTKMTFDKGRNMSRDSLEEKLDPITLKKLP